MKKRVLFVVCMALLLVVLMPVPVSAQQVQKMNAMSDTTGRNVPYATCNHFYSSWITVSSSVSTKVIELGKCWTLVEVQMRYCKKCEAAFAREKKTPLEHIKKGSADSWYCSRCGITGGIVR